MLGPRGDEHAGITAREIRSDRPGRLGDTGEGHQVVRPDGIDVPALDARGHVEIVVYGCRAGRRELAFKRHIDPVQDAETVGREVAVVPQRGRMTRDRETHRERNDDRSDAFSPSALDSSFDSAQ